MQEELLFAVQNDFPACDGEHKTLFLSHRDDSDSSARPMGRHQTLSSSPTAGLPYKCKSFRGVAPVPKPEVVGDIDAVHREW